MPVLPFFQHTGWHRWSWQHVSALLALLSANKLFMLCYSRTGWAGRGLMIALYSERINCDLWLYIAGHLLVQQEVEFNNKNCYSLLSSVGLWSEHPPINIISPTVARIISNVWSESSQMMENKFIRYFISLSSQRYVVWNQGQLHGRESQCYIDSWFLDP